VVGPEKPEGEPSPAEGSSAAGLASALAATRARAARGPPRRRRSRSPWIALGAGVVAVGLIAALLVGAYEGVRFAPPPKGGTTPPPGPTATSFYESLTPANAAARALYWDWPSNDEPPLVFAEGLASPTALGGMVNASHLGVTACAPTILSETIPTLPGYSGALTAGDAQGWLYAFITVGDTLLVLAVVNETATIVASTPSTGMCYSGPGSFSAVVIDSSVAAATAGGTREATAFLHDASENGTALSGELLLVPPGYVAHAPADPMWVVNDTSCTLYGTGPAVGTTLTSVVNAVSGALYNQSTVAVSC
jgi:hypothetical protein